MNGIHPIFPRGGMFSARKRAAQRPARMMRRESRSLLEEQAEGFAAVEAESSESAFVQGEDVAATPRGAQILECDLCGLAHRRWPARTPDTARPFSKPWSPPNSEGGDSTFQNPLRGRLKSRFSGGLEGGRPLPPWDARARIPPFCDRYPLLRILSAISFDFRRRVCR